MPKLHPSTWVILVVAGIWVIIPAIPFILAALCVSAIVRKHVQIEEPNFDSGQAHHVELSGD